MENFSACCNTSHGIELAASQADHLRSVCSLRTRKGRSIWKEPICHLHFSHNTPHLHPPPLQKKFCITFVFQFSCVLQPSQEKLKTMPMQNFEGSRCIVGDLQVAHRTIITSSFKIVLFCLPSWPQTCHKYRFGGRWDHRRTKRQQIPRTERKNTAAKTI